VNSRRIDDTVLTLGASGWTYVSTFVLYDRETESLWYPRRGEDDVYRFHGIGGPFAGRVLEPYPGTVRSWRDWVAAHPGSKIMR